MEEIVFLTKEQVAARWAVAVRTVERQVAKGKLIAYRFAKIGMRFKISDVQAFEEASRYQPPVSLQVVSPQPLRRGPKRKGSVVDFTGRQPRRKSA